jgi:hypothetical protein
LEEVMDAKENLIALSKVEFLALRSYQARRAAEQWVDGTELRVSPEELSIVEELRPPWWDIQTEADELKLQRTAGERWVIQYGQMSYPRRVYKDYNLAVAFGQHQQHEDTRLLVYPVRYFDGREAPLPSDTRMLTAEPLKS